MFFEFTKQDIEFLSNNQMARVALCIKSFPAFCFFYLAHKFPLDPAEYQKEIIKTLTSDQEFIAILGFRGSAKSTIIEAFAVWQTVTKQSPFTILIRDSIQNAKMSVANIRSEIESNKRIQLDFNIKVESRVAGMSEKWSAEQITINGCTILARSRGQKVRGLKFTKKINEGGTEDHRISTIICDDLEDVESTETLEKRAKTRQWFFTEVVPATAQGILSSKVKVIVIGNYVHKDCLIAHLEHKKIVRVHKFALYDSKGNVTWKALYPDAEAVAKQKARVMLAGKGMGNVIWNREYLLKLIDEADIIIKETDLLFYPKEWLQRKVEQSGIGIDFAISKKQTADYTAMIKGVIVKNDYGERRLLILPSHVNEHLGFTDTISKAKSNYIGMLKPCKVFAEKVQYQAAAIEMMKKNGMDVTGVTPTSDKRARLMSVSSYITSGMVLFAEEGLEDLITQLIGFGTEEHDDMVDALVYLIDGLLNNYSEFVFA